MKPRIWDVPWIVNQTDIEKSFATSFGFARVISLIPDSSKNRSRVSETFLANWCTVLKLNQIMDFAIISM